MTIKQFESVSEFIHQYDLFLVDLWGVVHDGEELYDGAKDCIEYLRSQNKKIIFISNAPKRAALTIDKLNSLGIKSDMYDHVITSGELTYDYITKGQHNLGNKYYLINEQEVDLMQGSEFEPVHSPEQADFVIAIGFKEPNSTLEELLPTLDICYKKNFPLICANPDLLVVSKAGIPWLCAGVLAQAYEEMGGNVTYFGKPYAQVYERAFSKFPDIAKKRIAAIGDNINTDIKGANNIGIDSYLIPGGIHAEELNISHGHLPEPTRFRQFCNIHDIEPKGVLAAFVK